MHACITPLLASPGRVHDPAECDDIANAVADRVCDGHAYSDPDKLADTVAVADLTSDHRETQRAERKRDLGARC
jgi:hypothetical protein